MDLYEQLRKILDAHPATAPPGDAIAEILRLLFTPEEAAVAGKMSFRAKSPADIARAAGLSEAEAVDRLEGMADKGVIFSRSKDGRKTYGLVPLIPGLFEFPFMKGGGSPLSERLAKLWETYHRESLGASFSGNPTPLMRVVAVEKSLTPQNRVHPYDEVRRLIENSGAVALAQCACRVSVARCDKPKDVCLIFDGVGEFLAERGFARKISKEEALAVLDRAEEAGLVHTSNNSADKASVICNCCPCCCTILRGRTQLNHPHAFAPSRFAAFVQSKDCAACGLCAGERCPVKAVEIGEEAALVHEDKCIGCGLCVSSCPTGAMTLIERGEIPGVPATTQDMALQVLQEKGRLEAFLKVMQS